MNKRFTGKRLRSIGGSKNAEKININRSIMNAESNERKGSLNETIPRPINKTPYTNDTTYNGFEPFEIMEKSEIKRYAAPKTKSINRA